MKTVQLKVDGHTIDNVYRKKGDTVLVVDEVADQLVKLGSADVVPPGEVRNAETVNRLAEIVTPYKDGDDPMHAARALSSDVNEHPGLVAAVDAGITGAPRRTAGRVVPEPEVITTTPADFAAKPAAPKPGK